VKNVKKIGFAPDSSLNNPIALLFAIKIQTLIMNRGGGGTF